MNFISGIYKWLKRYARAHKIISGIVLVVLLGVGWYAYGAATKTSAQTSYVLGTVSTSTVISTVSESGQVSATNQVDIQAKVSGNVTWVGVKAGDKVSAGQALASLDSTDAQQAVTNAQIALQAEELTLQQDTAQAPINYQNTQDSVTQAQLNLATAYDNTYSALSNAFAALHAVMASAHDLLYTNTVNTSYNNIDTYKNYFVNSDPSTESIITISAYRADQDYNTALASYNASYAEYKTLTRNSPTTAVEQALSDTDATVKLISQALGSDVNLIDTTVNLLGQLNKPVNASVTAQQTTAHTELTTANNTLSSITSQVAALQSAKTALTTAQQNLQIASIGNNASGTSPFSLQVEQNAVEQKKAALATAQQTLSYYTVRAPFAGVLAAVNVQPGDTTSGAVATLITNSQYADLAVNEVDAAKIAVGQKATMTFDAIPDLTVTGTVAEVNPAGTVSQGVVTYDVKIAFDAQNSQVKSGMTVNATIQTAVHQDVLAVPSSAIKTQGTASYVQVFTPPLASAAAASTQGVVTKQTPQNVPVTVGISDNTNSEIISGLSAGEQIIVRTVGSSATPSAASAATTRAGGGGFGGGGAIRIGG